MNIHRIGLSIGPEVVPIIINPSNISRSNYQLLIGPGDNPYNAYIAVTKELSNDCVRYRRSRGHNWLLLPTHPWSLTV